MTQYLLKLEELKNQLAVLGYHNYQIDGIIRDAVDGEDLSRLSAEQQQHLLEELEQYISFASKCKKKSK